jgi:spore maturation protein CgeB
VKIVIFGLTITSTWGNGHATLWRGLCRALHARGHRIVFFERDVPYYAAHRDLGPVAWCRVVLYESWDETADAAAREIADADVGMATSYCPDGASASRMLIDADVARKVFYDLDSPVTLDRLARGEPVAYLPEDGLGEFDLVLSYAGGRAIAGLKERLGARAVAPLYGSVDPAVHYPVPPVAEYRSDLSYLGTYAADRQELLERLFITPARLRPALRFTLAGSQYPEGFTWTENLAYVSHVPPAEHPSFYCSSNLTLNITRGAMAAVGYCPSGRIFEATACGAVVLSDWWPGLDDFFEPGREILLAHGTDDVLHALDLGPQERRRIGTEARERTLSCHTAAIRARELETLLEPDWSERAGVA